MGGNASKAVAKKALRPLKNVAVEERALKAVEKHKTKPVVAPRHSSSKEKIESQVSENPHVKEEIKKHDLSLVDRVNRLQLEISDSPLKFTSKDRPLPQNKELVEDPLKAFENPRRVPKGTITHDILFNILNKPINGPITFESEIIAKEHDLNTQEVLNILQYFEKLNLQDETDEETKKLKDGKSSSVKNDEVNHVSDHEKNLNKHSS
ncbi:mitochondrial respiratory chain complex I assembly [Mactra antiquata]